MNLLHIIDDKKFIKICQETFNIEGINNYYLNSGEINLNYLKDNNIQIIFVHFLRIPEIHFFAEQEIGIPKIWMFWGADGFSLPSFYNIFLDSLSKKIAFDLAKRNGYKRLLIHLTKIFLKPLLNRNSFNQKKLNVINSFDYIVPIVPSDYDLLRQKYNIKVPMFHFNYVTPLIENNKELGNNILLGNSATLSNNHLSIIKKLEAENLGSRKVYIPLNYGNEDYKNYILNYLKDKPQFIPLIDFMPIEEYNEIISSCGIMIMNHKRQQALGNIILGLMNGCTIYLNKESKLYKYLSINRFRVYDINELKINNFLSSSEKLENIKLTKEYFGKVRQTQNIQILFNKIYNKCT